MKKQQFIFLLQVIHFYTVFKRAQFCELFYLYEVTHFIDSYNVTNRVVKKNYFQIFRPSFGWLRRIQYGLFTQVECKVGWLDLGTFNFYS